MADRDQYPAAQRHGPQLRPEKTQGPTKSQILAAVTVVPIGAFLLFLAGITFVGTLIGLAVTTPLFILFSPVLVPAALTVGLAVTGFLTSGAFGITALSSFSWIVSYVRKMRGQLPQQLEQAKKKAEEMGGQVGQKAREVGHAAQGKTQEGTGGRTETTRA